MPHMLYRPPLELSITRYLDAAGQEVGGTIAREEWIRYIRDSPLLQLDAGTVGKHPLTGDELEINPQADIAWLSVGQMRLPIQFNDGELWLGEVADQTALRALKAIAFDLHAVLWDSCSQSVIAD